MSPELPPPEISPKECKEYSESEGSLNECRAKTLTVASLAVQEAKAKRDQMLAAAELAEKEASEAERVADAAETEALQLSPRSAPQSNHSLSAEEPPTVVDAKIEVPEPPIFKSSSPPPATMSQPIGREMPSEWDSKKNHTKLLKQKGKNVGTAPREKEQEIAEMREEPTADKIKIATTAKAAEVSTQVGLPMAKKPSPLMTKKGLKAPLGPDEEMKAILKQERAAKRELLDSRRRKEPVPGEAFLSPEELAKVK